MIKLRLTKGIILSVAALFLMNFASHALHEKDAKEAAISAAKKSAGATITGTVTYEGKVHKLRVLDMSAEPACAGKHNPPAKSQALVLGAGNQMANIFVKVKSGLSKTHFDPPKEPFVVNQSGCVYEPHVFGVMVGQPIKFLNSDGVLHNVHPLPKKNRPFNLAMPKTIKETTKKFKKVEETMFVIKCDVHPWMRAYMCVMSHPFYSVTGKNGKFTISGLEPGTYEIEAWHEKLGTRTASVTVKAGETQTADITFSLKKK